MEPGRRGAAARRARAHPARRRARGGAAAAAEALTPDEGEGATGLVALAERAVAPLEAARAGAAARRRRAARRRAAPARDRLRPARVPRLARGGARPPRGARGGARPDRGREAPLPLPRRYEELLARAAEARAELAALDGRRRSGRSWPRASSPPPRRGSTRSRVELRAERNAAAPAFADAVAAELRGVGMGDGEFVCELRERDEPGATGADEAVFLVRPNAGPAVRAGRGDRVRRRAVAHRARDRGGRRRGDARLRRDRRRHRRRDRERGRRVLRRLAERAQVITITHLPQIAALADRHFRVEKIAGRPDAHADRAARRRRAASAELERMLGGQEFLAAVRRLDRDAARAGRGRLGVPRRAVTTSPTGGPGIVGVEPDRRGSPPGRAGRSGRARTLAGLPARPSAARARDRCSSSRSCRSERSPSSSSSERIDVELDLEPVEDGETRVDLSSRLRASGAGAATRVRAARSPRLYDLVQTLPSRVGPPAAAAATLKSRERTGPEVRLRHRGSRLGARQGHRRRVARPAAEGARPPRAAAEVRPVPQRRPGDDEPVPARRGVRHRGRGRDRPRHRPLRALRRRELPRAARTTARARSGTPCCARSARASSSARRCR